MKSIFITQKSETIVVDVENIAYVMAEGNYSDIYQLGQIKPLVCCKRLLEIEDMLSGSNFYRINRNTLINMNLISRIRNVSGKSVLMLKGYEDDFTVSRRRVGELKLRLKDHHSQI